MVMVVTSIIVINSRIVIMMGGEIRMAVAIMLMGMQPDQPTSEFIAPSASANRTSRITISKPCLGGAGRPNSSGSDRDRNRFPRERDGTVLDEIREDSAW